MNYLWGGSIQGEALALVINENVNMMLPLQNNDKKLIQPEIKTYNGCLGLIIL
jgi:hypothetical protein